MNVSLSPLVPMTGRTACFTAASATTGVQARFVKSMTTSGFSSPSAASGSEVIGRTSPDASVNLSDSANFSRTPTGSMPSAASRASAMARPIFPLPETTTRMFSLMFLSVRDESVAMSGASLLRYSARRVPPLQHYRSRFECQLSQ